MGAGPGESYLQPESVWEQFGVHCAAVSPPFPKCQLLRRRENCMSLTWMLLCSSLVLETFFIQWSNKHQPWSSLAHLQLLLIL